MRLCTGACANLYAGMCWRDGRCVTLSLVNPLRSPLVPWNHLRSCSCIIINNYQHHKPAHQRRSDTLQRAHPVCVMFVEQLHSREECWRIRGKPPSAGVAAGGLGDLCQRGADNPHEFIFWRIRPPDLRGRRLQHGLAAVAHVDDAPAGASSWREPQYDPALHAHGHGGALAATLY